LAVDAIMNGGKLTEKATFAAGCFWHVEHTFSAIKGVLSTRAGYTGGDFKNPSYEDVCSGSTGHAESVEIEFDPSKVSYKDLLKTFWDIHDPTQLNRQGPDHGTQYRSAIFFHTAEQRAEALESRDAMQRMPRYIAKKIVTEIVAAKEFWPAEEYHQKYLEKHGQASCRL
jgi:peptide-methionine (S)-S-oxide reductase